MSGSGSSPMKLTGQTPAGSDGSDIGSVAGSVEEEQPIAVTDKTVANWQREVGQNPTIRDAVVARADLDNLRRTLRAFRKGKLRPEDLAKTNGDESEVSEGQEAESTISLANLVRE